MMNYNNYNNIFHYCSVFNDSRIINYQYAYVLRYIFQEYYITIFFSKYCIVHRLKCAMK